MQWSSTKTTSQRVLLSIDSCFHSRFKFHPILLFELYNSVWTIWICIPLKSLYESDDEEVARSFPIAALRLAKLFQNPKIRSICLVQSLRLRKVFPFLTVFLTFELVANCIFIGSLLFFVIISCIQLVFLFCGVSNALAEYRTHHKDDSNEIVDFQDIMNDLVRTVFEFLPKKVTFIV